MFIQLWLSAFKPFFKFDINATAPICLHPVKNKALKVQYMNHILLGTTFWHINTLKSKPLVKPLFKKPGLLWLINGTFLSGDAAILLGF